MRNIKRKLNCNKSEFENTSLLDIYTAVFENTIIRYLQIVVQLLKMFS